MPNLGDIAEISAGHAFRGAVIPDKDAEYLVIQMKDVDSETLVNWRGAELATPPGKKAPACLAQGDIIFLARGRHNYAIHFSEPPPVKIICTQHFFVIRVVDNRFKPAFVAWQINQAYAQDHFDKNAVGGKNRNITLTALKHTEMVQGSSANQNKIEELTLLIEREQQLFRHLMANRKNQISAIASVILEQGIAE